MKGAKKNSAKENNREIGLKQDGFRIPYPFILLSLTVLIVYGASVNLGFTELDDSIFIKEQHQYNEDLANLVTSFKRGVFNVTEDVYYRPLLLNSFILNYQVGGMEIKSYHV
ncbi:MAG: hypothetical protein ABIO46_13640, partial [Chitinophagales bacterium]